MTRFLRRTTTVLAGVLLWDTIPLVLDLIDAGPQDGQVAAQDTQDPQAAQGVVQPDAADGASYMVGALEVQYVRDLPFLPPLSDPTRPSVASIQIQLSPTADGYVAPREGAPIREMTLQELGDSGPTRLYASAVDSICRAITEWFASRPGSLLVLVVPSPSDITPGTGQDLRARDRANLRLLISYEGPSFGISRFTMSYTAGDHPGLPPIDEVIGSVQCPLARTEAGFFAWRPTVEPVPFRLADLTGAEPQTFSAGAIQRILEAVVQYLTARDLMAVQVVPTANQLDLNNGQDLRGGNTELDLTIIVGIVSQVRTLAAGERIPLEDRENHQAHAFILSGSPFQASDGAGAERQDILKKNELDEYLFRLSRHPGRRVDASLAPASGSPDYGVSLDYLVSENKEMLLYSQISNTGTEPTDEMRYRFGLFHNQLTGNDDLFNLEYITAGFEESHAILASYEGRAFGSDEWRWRGFGSWSEFTASEVGFTGEAFTGDSWQVGAELVKNIYQDRQLFVDAVGGVRFQHIAVNNEIVGVNGEEDFLLPYLGLRLQRHTQEVKTDATALLEANVASVDPIQLGRLGRVAPDDDWMVFRWDASHSFYIEPLLARNAGAAQPPALANEIALRFRGQYAFDHRLIPQEEQVAGGLYSVRGYPESVAVGDTVILGTVEYRFHVAHSLGFDPNPTEFLGRPFRFRPQYAYGAADWDLVLRGFVDIGRTINSNPLSFENNQTLIGAGFGLEIQYRTNVSLRMDVGFALEDLPGLVESGSSEFHFGVTLVY